ncbi:MAG: Ig-like domain-containing protein, partial [Treponema sp.]|nr:Ig-like domain-containing protein [Treponema sp.]
FTNELTKTGDGTVTYASSKTDVAEVNTQTGLVTIKGAGETTITATVADSDTYTYETKTASYTLTVTAADTTPQKTAGSISYATTSVEKTTADGTFTNELTTTGDGTVTYASSKTDVAEVNTQTGLVTIKGAGVTTITATVADSETYTYATKTATYTLTVTAAAATKTLTLTGEYDDYDIGGYITKSLEIEYTDNDTWKDIAERYDEVSLENNYYGPSEGKVVMFWGSDGCQLKSNESTYNYKLVSINDKVSAYSSYYLD